MVGWSRLQRRARATGDTAARSTSDGKRGLVPELRGTAGGSGDHADDYRTGESPPAGRVVIYAPRADSGAAW